MHKQPFLLLLLIVSCYSISSAQNNFLHTGQVPPRLSFTSYRTSATVTYAGQDLWDTVYLIDFWATWCSPCIASIPHMDSLMQTFKGQRVKFVSITYEPRERVKMFLREHPINSEIGIDPEFTMFKQYNAWAIPNIVMINSKGKIAGRIHPDRLTEHVIEELIAGKVPVVKNTPEDLFDPAKAEEYFRSLLVEKK